MNGAARVAVPSEPFIQVNAETGPKTPFLMADRWPLETGGLPEGLLGTVARCASTP